jgi:hypothetical protein
VLSKLGVVGELGRDHLERDLEIEALVACQVDEAHTALADHAQDREVTQSIACAHGHRGEHQPALQALAT